MQQPTPEGLRPATEGERRWLIVPIYNATEAIGHALEQMWATRTPLQAIEVLRQPDVTVTNESDKLIQLEKLEGLDRRVRTTPLAP